MNTTIRKVAATFAVCAVLIAGAANAQTQYRSGSGGYINDAPSGNNNTTGSPGTTNSFTFSTTGGTIGNLDSIDLIGLFHQWQGDLTMSLTHVQSGTAVTFYNMNRFNKEYYPWINGSYSFSDRIGANSIVNYTTPASGEYEAFNSNGDGTVSYGGSDRYFRSSFDAFDGLTMNTDWKLDITDRYYLAFGSLNDWGMTITSAPSAVPEPGEWAAMGVLGFGLVGLVVRGRRRLAN